MIRGLTEAGGESVLRFSHRVDMRFAASSFLRKDTDSCSLLIQSAHVEEVNGRERKGTTVPSANGHKSPRFSRRLNFGSGGRQLALPHRADFARGDVGFPRQPRRSPPDPDFNSRPQSFPERVGPAHRIRPTLPGTDGHPEAQGGGESQRPCCPHPKSRDSDTRVPPERPGLRGAP